MAGSVIMMGEKQDAQRLLDAYKEVIGNAAIGIAKRHSTVTIEDGDVVAFEGGKQDMHTFVEAYEDILGDVATRIARDTLSDEYF